MAGPGIRAWEMASMLAGRHEVALATTAKICERTSSAFRTVVGTDDELAALERWCEVMVVQGYALHHVPALRHSEKTMVVDLYDPLHLETLELSRPNPASVREPQVALALATMVDQLRRGDFFLCANDRQRDLWIGHLLALGRITPATYDADPALRKLVATVPFGLPSEDLASGSPVLKGVVEGIGVHDEVILWAGGVYDWLDPLTLIRALAALALRRPRVRLFFMGMTHPNPEVPPMAMALQARRLADELGLTDKHVFFNQGWVDYDMRGRFLAEADVAVSTHLDHAETRFSFRTRMLDYLWAALPVVCSAGDAFADLVDAEGLGVVVAPGDPVALEEALWRVLDDASLSLEARRNAARVRERFEWSVVLAPLVEFCDRPTPAPGRQTLAGPQTLAGTQTAPECRTLGGQSITAKLRRRVLRGVAWTKRQAVMERIRTQTRRYLR